MPRHLSAEDERRAFQANYAAIAAYLHQMDIGPDLLAAARKIPRDQIHILSREEIVAFGIDRRAAAESAWALLDTPSGESAVKLIEARDAEATAFHRELLSVICRDKTTARLQYARETGAATAPGGFRLTAGGRSLALTRLADRAQSGNHSPLQRLYADLPLSALGDTAFVIEPNETSGQSTDGAARPSVRLTIQAAAPALAALAQRCGSGAH
jgi:hypothetical protein